MNYHVCIYEPCVKMDVKMCSTCSPLQIDVQPRPPLPTSYPWIQTDRPFAPLVTRIPISAGSRRCRALSTHTNSWGNINIPQTPLMAKRVKSGYIREGWTMKRQLTIRTDRISFSDQDVAVELADVADCSTRRSHQVGTSTLRGWRSTTAGESSASSKAQAKRILNLV